MTEAGVVVAELRWPGRVPGPGLGGVDVDSWVLDGRSYLVTVLPWVRGRL